MHSTCASSLITSDAVSQMANPAGLQANSPIPSSTLLTCWLTIGNFDPESIFIQVFDFIIRVGPDGRQDHCILERLEVVLQTEHLSQTIHLNPCIGREAVSIRFHRRFLSKLIVDIEHVVVLEIPPVLLEQLGSAYNARLRRFYVVCMRF